jgi:SHS family sialic acid transporter-like MFS transporter
MTSRGGPGDYRMTHAEFSPTEIARVAEAPPSRDRWMALIAALLGWMFDGVEQGLFPLAGRPALRELLSVDIPGDISESAVGLWFGRIITMFLVGAAFGGLAFGWLGDRIGRVRAMTLSVLTYSVFTGLCAFASTPWQLGALRLVASVGMGGEWALGVALVMEVWPSRSRPLMAGLIGMSANLGFLIIGVIGLGLAHFVEALGSALREVMPDAWVAFLLRSSGWRMLFLLGAMPALLTFFIRIFVPESEKWRQAMKVAAKPRVSEIFAPHVRRHSILGVSLAGLPLLGTWGAIQWIQTWAGQMTQDPSAVAWTQICVAGGAVIGAFSMALVSEKLNRRRSYFAVMTATFIACQIFFRVPIQFGWLFLAGTFLTSLLAAGFYGWLPLYLPELFPTRIRATGSGFSYNGGRLLAAAGTMTSGTLVAAFDGNYAGMAAIMSFVYLIGAVIIWLAPETRGQPLPD